MADLIHWPPSWSMLLLLPALFVGFTVHELAHGLAAYLLGDTSQVERNRLSFNPLHHVSWVGMGVFLLFRFGWAKPVWMDASRFRIRNRAFGMFLVSMAGPLANLLTGLLALVGITTTVMIVWILTGAVPTEVLQSLMQPEPGPDLQGLAVALSYFVVTVNISLGFFNLLPFPPLDGFQAVVSLVAAVRWAFGSDTARERVAWEGASKTVAEGAVEELTADDGTTDEPLVGDLDARSPAQIHFEIGLEYQRLEQWDEAIARYRQATSHDEQFALAYYNLGLAYWAKGRISLAESAFRAALQSDYDLAVRIQADRWLRELANVEHDPNADQMPVPPPLELGGISEAEVAGEPALDRAAVRRVWITLAVGGIGMAVLAISAWTFVTIVALMSAV